MSTLLVTGDDFRLPVNLTLNSVAYPVTGATINVCVVSEDHSMKLTAAESQSSSESGANWATGLVVVKLSAAGTSAIHLTGFAHLEILVTLSGTKTTWFVPIEIVKGHIS